MRLQDLMDVDYDFTIEGITEDSREVKENYIFVATNGYFVDHYDYIEDAVDKGCVFLIVDREIDFDFPHIVVENINSYYQELCIKFYNINLEKFHFIGITGTDGKTSTTSIIHQIINDSAYLGTNGLDVCGEHYATHNTTPCVSEFYQKLEIIQKHQISNISMEVSSEALLHNRISNILFDFVAITNVTGDHFNIHKTFQNYLNCKLKILDMLKKGGILLLNGDDESLKSIQREKCYHYGFSKSCDYWIEKVKYFKKKTIITLNHNGHQTVIYSPLIGKFNVYNVVLAYIVCLLFGIDENIILQRIRKLKHISGRCEFLDFHQEYPIVLDYAHTINGISNILDTFPRKKIITVTGCAGGRDQSKRRLIGKLIMSKSTLSIFTMDDPRYEDVDTIINEMVGNDTNYIRIVNRNEAIYYALSHADKDSVVLILGKGRDSYMAIEDRKIPYSDYDVIESYFLEKYKQVNIRV